MSHEVQGTSRGESIIIIITTIQQRTRVKRGHIFFLKKCLFCLSFNLGAIERHFEKGTHAEFYSQVLCPRTVKYVVADGEFSILGAVNMKSMRVHALVEWLSCFTNVHGITSGTEHDIDHIPGAT